MVSLFLLATCFKTCVTDAVCPTPTDVVNAKISVVEGDRTSFGSIIKYECNPGYELVGIPLLFCKGHNSWSSVPPSCKSINTLVCVIKNENGLMIAFSFR